MAQATQRGSEIVETIKRAFAEFLTLPSIVIGGFLVLAAVATALDTGDVRSLDAVRDFLRANFFSSGQATSDLLGAIATGLITLTSITISLLLIAVQQAAAAMSTQIFDQFLRRSLNQFYFGFFVGLSLYALLILSTVTDTHNPVFGATFALLLTFAALILLLLLLYTTINQMRPATIIEVIHDHILRARERQAELLGKTRRTSALAAPVRHEVRSSSHGYIATVDLAALEGPLREAKRPVEIVLRAPLGAFVARHDVIAEIKADDGGEADRLASPVAAAIHLELQQDVALDPGYGIEQLETIAWTSISTSKQNPAPGLLVVQALRDVLSRWAHEQRPPEADAQSRVVIPDDAERRLLEAFESLAVVASESMQHQVFAEILLAFAALYDRLPPPLRDAVDDRILRNLTGLGNFVLTSELERSLVAMESVLTRAGRPSVASAIAKARQELAKSRGRLASRSTRASPPG